MEYRQRGSDIRVRALAIHKSRALHYETQSSSTDLELEYWDEWVFGFLRLRKSGRLYDRAKAYPRGPATRHL